VAGVVIDRVDAAGNLTPSALPSPQSTPRMGGYIVLSVNQAEDRAWVGGWNSYDSAAGGGTFWASHWNGTAWQRLYDVPLYDTWGIGRSVGWNGGLAMVALDTVTFAPWFATIRTTP
jgi:hypothetical protein